VLTSRKFGRRLALGEQGVSYTEVLMSLTLVSVGVLGFSLNTVSVIQGNHRSADYTVAANLAQDKMEQLKAQPAPADIDNCPAAGERGITATGAPGGVYDRCWTVKNSIVGSGLKEIVVIVSWKEAEIRSIKLSTLVAVE
jgi:Tfp pilus assembly protein PilV